MKKWMKVIFLLAIAGIFAALAGYFFVYNKPHKDYARAKPDYILSAEACYQSFVNNRQESETLYNGKVIQLTGIPARQEQNDSLAVVVFVFSQGIFGDEGIRCTLLPEYSDQTIVAEGMEITLKGYLTGFNDTDVILEQCSVVAPD